MEKKRSIGRIFFVTVILLATLSKIILENNSGEQVSVIPQSDISYENSELVNDIISLSVKELNRGMPIMLNQELRLDSINIGSGNSMIYNHTFVNHYVDQLDVDSFFETNRSALIKKIFINPDLKIFRDNKVTMIYSYKDRNGRMFSKFVISASEYNNNVVHHIN